MHRPQRVRTLADGGRVVPFDVYRDRVKWTEERLLAVIRELEFLISEHSDMDDEDTRLALTMLRRSLQNKRTLLAALRGGSSA